MKTGERQQSEDASLRGTPRTTSKIFFIFVVLLSSLVILMGSRVRDLIPDVWVLAGLAPVPFILALTAFILEKGVSCRILPWFCAANGHLIVISGLYTLAFSRMIITVLWRIQWPLREGAWFVLLLFFSPYLTLLAACLQIALLSKWNRVMGWKTEFWRWWWYGALVAGSLLAGSLFWGEGLRWLLSYIKTR